MLSVLLPNFGCFFFLFFFFSKWMSEEINCWRKENKLILFIVTVQKRLFVLGTKMVASDFFPPLSGYINFCYQGTNIIDLTDLFKTGHGAPACCVNSHHILMWQVLWIKYGQLLPGRMPHLSYPKPSVLEEQSFEKLGPCFNPSCTICFSMKCNILFLAE